MMFLEIVAKMDSLLRDLEASPRRSWDTLQFLSRRGGVYVFYECGHPIYVGRTRHIQERIRQHGDPSSRKESATFAFQLLKDKVPTQKRTRAEIERDYASEFAHERERIRKMCVRAVEIEDQVVQTFFELYAILALDTMKYNANAFRTH